MYGRDKDAGGKCVWGKGVCTRDDKEEYGERGWKRLYMGRGRVINRYHPGGIHPTHGVYSPTSVVLATAIAYFGGRPSEAAEPDRAHTHPRQLVAVAKLGDGDLGACCRCCVCVCV